MRGKKQSTFKQCFETASKKLGMTWKIKHATGFQSAYLLRRQSAMPV